MSGATRCGRAKMLKQGNKAEKTREQCIEDSQFAHQLSCYTHTHTHTLTTDGSLDSVSKTPPAREVHRCLGGIDEHKHASFLQSHFPKPRQRGPINKGLLSSVTKTPSVTPHTRGLVTAAPGIRLFSICVSSLLLLSSPLLSCPSLVICRPKR